MLPSKHLACRGGWAKPPTIRRGISDACWALRDRGCETCFANSFSLKLLKVALKLLEATASAAKCFSNLQNNFKNALRPHFCSSESQVTLSWGPLRPKSSNFERHFFENLQKQLLKSIEGSPRRLRSPRQKLGNGSLALLFGQQKKDLSRRPSWTEKLSILRRRPAYWKLTFRPCINVAVARAACFISKSLLITNTCFSKCPSTLHTQTLKTLSSNRRITSHGLSLIQIFNPTKLLEIPLALLRV